MNDIRVHVATGTIIKIVLILIAFYLLYILRDVVMLLIASVVIAAAVEPAAEWFIRHKIPRLPAVIIVYIAGLLALAGVFYFFIPPLISQVITFIQSIPTYVSQIDILNEGTHEALFGQLTSGVSLKNLLSQIQTIASGISGGVFQALSTIFGGILSFILVLVISFYLAAQDRGIENFLKLVSPGKSQKYVISLWTRAQTKIGLWLQGQLLLGLIIGVLVYLGLTVIGVPNALLLAVIAGLFELIPIFGPILAAIPAVLIGLTVSPTVALLVVGLYVIVQQFENYLIQPMVVQKVVGISPLIAIIALIVGAQLAGLLGVILSVPIAAVVMEFVGDVAKERNTEGANLAQEASHKKEPKKQKQS